MRLMMIAFVVVLILVVDQFRFGGHYRTVALGAVERSVLMFVR